MKGRPMTAPVPLVTAEPSAYLGPDDVVQSDHPEIARLARELRLDARDDTAFAKSAYEWVRDQVTHSVDAQDPRVTVTASEVLGARTSLCYARLTRLTLRPGPGRPVSAWHGPGRGCRRRATFGEGAPRPPRVASRLLPAYPSHRARFREGFRFRED